MERSIFYNKHYTNESIEFHQFVEKYFNKKNIHKYGIYLYSPKVNINNPYWSAYLSSMLLEQKQRTIQEIYELFIISKNKK
jgi:hypothetical protein